MRFIPSLALATTASLLALASCTNLTLTQEQTDKESGSGCCSTCGCCNGCETTDPTPEPEACSCPRGYTVTPAGDGCFRESLSDPTQNATTYNVCRGDTKFVYGNQGAKVVPGGTAPGLAPAEENSYWGDGSTSPLNGRLNEIGVWACPLPGVPVGADHPPVGEWIGFALCTTLEEGGEYILGIAGDNAVRMDIDGTNVFLLDSNATANFNYWHLLPIHLSSGPHVIELSGKNNGEIAAFGAEIAGPFAAGALNTDAAVLDVAEYQAKLVWSTGTLDKEDVFNLGESSGWQCPGETALDLCSDKPVCKHIDYVPCESTRPTPTPATSATPAAEQTKK